MPPLVYREQKWSSADRGEPRHLLLSYLHSSGSHCVGSFVEVRGRPWLVKAIEGEPGDLQRFAISGRFRGACWPDWQVVARKVPLGDGQMHRYRVFVTLE